MFIITWYRFVDCLHYASKYSVSKSAHFKKNNRTTIIISTLVTMLSYRTVFGGVLNIGGLPVVSVSAPLSVHCMSESESERCECSDGVRVVEGGERNQSERAEPSTCGSVGRRVRV